MPSPFPGMDPYLEQHQWVSFHHALTGIIAAHLMRQIRPRYVARIMDYVLMDTEHEDYSLTIGAIYPDVDIVDHQIKESAAVYKTAPPLPIEIPTEMPKAVKHPYIEIRDTEKKDVVTVIEILSPTNKRGKGFKQYIEKRNKILLSKTHLLEIDLLRKGKRVPTREPLPNAPYFMFLSRVSKRPVMDVWPVQLWDALPNIPIPLAKDEEIAFALQAAFTETVDTFMYDASLDYSKMPPFDLEPKQVDYVCNLLNIDA